jgi:hypothetical protein
MKISSDDQKGISVILIFLGLLSFLIGVAAHFKASFHSRAELTTAGFVAAAVLAGLGVLLFLLSLAKKKS